MDTMNKWEFSKAQQNQYIENLSTHLSVLRAKTGISQSELANLLGITRQTYSSIERGSSKMSWNVYLSILFFYDCNDSTHKMLRDLNLYPDELIEIFNGGNKKTDKSGIAGIPDNIIEKLDDAAFQAIRTVVMLEYARCEKLPGDVVVRSFDGITFGKIDKSVKVDLALKTIKESRRKDE